MPPSRRVVTEKPLRLLMLWIPASRMRSAIGLIGVQVNLADALGHHRVGDVALPRGKFAIGIEPAGEDTEHAAHGTHG